MSIDNIEYFYSDGKGDTAKAVESVFLKFFVETLESFPIYQLWYYNKYIIVISEFADI